MKKISLILIASILFANYSIAQEQNYYVTYAADTIYVGDTVSVGNAVLGQYSTITRNSSEKIKKAKKGVRLAGLAGSVAGAVGVGTGTLGGLQTAVKGVQVASTASTIEDILGVSEVLANSTVDKKLIITKFFEQKGSNYAEAENVKGTKFTIALPEALLANEIILLK